ncbi:MAG: TetR/AcrR family transcriptional regulator [Candidatus Contendobacter sp.]|nr:TetR/AcrR family transcriptional regulator [Candidatus Contendobacter sp.]MDS4059043.1 TetR/AcrR family transcriptional regulator [Candidatus Contendobacter sp.]
MEDDTRQRLLDTAEALFAEHGFAETSLRAITTQARANLAAVHYHFGSKDELLRAVFARRLKVLNEERLARLAALETGGPVTVEAVLTAFIEPSLRLRRAGGQGERFTRLLGRAQIEASAGLRDFLRDQYAPVLERFQQTLGRTLPQLQPEELRWRLYFTLGVLSFTYAGARLPQIPFAARVAGDEEWLLRQLIQFLAVGLRAPPLEERAEETA